MLCLLIFLSCKNVFSEGFNDYINGIKTSSQAESAVGACKNVCPKSDYYQLTFGLPITNMSRCACVPLSQGVGALLVGFTQFLLSSIGVLAVILIIVAGFMRAFSAGNATVVKKTNEIMKNAFIGVIAVIFSGSALAIINPDLVNTGIFAVKISKIDVPCVDDTKDKSDGAQDKYYTDVKTGKRYQKNCSYTCSGNDCVHPENTACMCDMYDNTRKIEMNMCLGSCSSSSSYCDVEGGVKEPKRISGKCYKRLPNGSACVRGSGYSCSSGYCDKSGLCNNPVQNENTCSGDFGCWQYKSGSKVCITKRCNLPTDCGNSDFTCYSEFCVPEYYKCLDGDIVKCGASKCNQDDPY